MKEILLEHWQKFLIVILTILMILFWQLYVSKAKELKNKVDEAKIEETIKKIDATLEDIKKRETELYPSIKKSLADLETDRKKIQEAIKKIKTKEEISKNVKKLYEKTDNAGVVNEFNAMGYSSTVVGGSK